MYNIIIKLKVKDQIKTIFYEIVSKALSVKWYFVLIMSVVNYRL